VTLGVSVNNLQKLFRGVSSQDQLWLGFDLDQPDFLLLSIWSSERQSSTRLQFRLLELDVEQISPPAQEMQFHVQMPGAEFVRLIRSMSVVSDEVAVQCSPEDSKLQLRAAGDIGWLEEDVISGGDTAVQASADAQGFIARFSLKYLSTFSRGATLSRVVSVYLSPDYPVIVTWTNELLTMRMMLAPKIGDDDDGGEGM